MSTNVSGASVKVASGSEIKAEGTATGTASGAAFTTGKLAIGTYEVTVSKEGYKDKTESVSIVNGDVNVDIQLEKLAEPTVATASAIGAKKIQVVLDSPATDTTKAKIIIKKGAVDVNTDKVTFSDDKKTALVETAAKLTKGDYTITVSGVATKDITTKLTAEDEKVAKIDVTTKTAPYIVTENTDSKKKALVSYKVYNQYGEDVTSATQGISWTVSTGVKIDNSDVNVADGTVKITNSGNAEFIPGSKVYLTGVYAATGVVVNAELTVGVESKADQVVFKGVYNKSTKKFESLPANFADDKYLLLFDVNDQYGIKMAPATVADNEKNLVFTSSNPLFVKASNANITTIDVADTTYCALKLIRGEKPENGGKATIQVISNVTGKTASYDLDATAAPQLKTFTMSAPQSLIAKGDKVEIPFTAVDQYGKAFNNFKALKDLVGNGLTIPENSEFVEQKLSLSL